MTFNNIQYGVVLHGAISQRLNIVSAITNVFWNGDGGVEQTDAALLLMRRTFGCGRTNITLFRQDAWMVREPAQLQAIAQNVADHLLAGSANTHEINAISDMILNNVEKLMMHPPESVAELTKKQEKQMERDGLLLRVNGQTLVDAR
jgi:hypothetical protein